MVMTTPFAALLDRTGWTAPHVAGLLGCGADTVYRWTTGRNTRGNPCAPPPDVLAWIDAVVSAVERVPVPRR